MDHDVLQAKEQYLPGPEWDLVRKSVPILCVDVLLSPAGDSRQVGLIRRNAPQGQGWCLVGGRVLRNEHLPVAVERHVAATLGPGVRVDRSTLELGRVRMRGRTGGPRRGARVRVVQHRPAARA